MSDESSDADTDVDAESHEKQTFLGEPGLA